MQLLLLDKYCINVKHFPALDKILLSQRAKSEQPQADKQDSFAIRRPTIAYEDVWQ